MIQKKTSKETQEAGAKADNDDKKIKPKESEKKDKTEKGKENDPVIQEKEVKKPQPLKESVSYNSEKKNLGKEILQLEKIENSNTSLAPIALVLSIIALLVSVMLAVSSKSVTHEGGTSGKQQLNLTGKFRSSLVKMESISQRLENVEGRIAEFDLGEKVEKEKRGIIELQKALLNLQEAQSLIDDYEMAWKTSKIEKNLKSMLALPEEKETGNELTTQMDENSAPAEKESEEEIVESEIIEPTVEIAGPEGETGDTVIEMTVNETELQLSETE